MIKFGIIGTNIITEALLSAATHVDGFQLTSVYSRSLDKAKLFSEKYGAEYIFDDLEVMAKSPHIDAVYIASPNSLHCEQACLFLDQRKDTDRFVLLGFPFCQGAQARCCGTAFVAAPAVDCDFRYSTRVARKSSAVCTIPQRAFTPTSFIWSASNCSITLLFLTVTSRSAL